MSRNEPFHRLIVVGASGVIGSQLFSDAVAARLNVVGTVCQNIKSGFLFCNLHNQTVTNVIPDLGVGDCVYLLAANTDPKRIAENPAAARALNVEATIASASTALDTGARVVFVSSDQVFDGDRGTYKEDDAPNPLNLYGWQKVEVEDYLRGSPGNWCIVRTGWNVGWRPDQRCPVRNTYRSLLEPTARMAEDNIFSLTDVSDTSQALLLLAQGSGQEIWHVAAQPAISRTSLADAVIHHSRFSDGMAYARAQMAEIPYKEPRPAHSSLTSTRFYDRFGLRFEEPLNVIERKVALLDSWFSEERVNS
tara:strand:- start:106 stop:1026 length:921 start_codon:yes stop_codon:yes gene_type:complete